MIKMVIKCLVNIWFYKLFIWISKSDITLWPNSAKTENKIETGKFFFLKSAILVTVKTSELEKKKSKLKWKFRDFTTVIDMNPTPRCKLSCASGIYDLPFTEPERSICGTSDINSSRKQSNALYTRFILAECPFSLMLVSQLFLTDQSNGSSFILAIHSVL